MFHFNETFYIFNLPTVSAIFPLTCVPFGYFNHAHNATHPVMRAKKEYSSSSWCSGGFENWKWEFVCSSPWHIIHGLPLLRNSGTRQEKKRRALELTSFAEAASIQPGRKNVCIHFGAEGCIHISSLPPPPEGKRGNFVMMGISKNSNAFFPSLAKNQLAGHFLFNSSLLFLLGSRAALARRAVVARAMIIWRII